MTATLSGLRTVVHEASLDHQGISVCMVTKQIAPFVSTRWKNPPYEMRHSVYCVMAPQE
jgi:hypothetical protein